MKIFSLILLPLLSGCASAPDLRPLHVASDAAAVAITGLYQATERSIEREVRNKWAVCDKLVDVDSRIECRKAAVTNQFESTLTLRKKLDQATNAHRILAVSLETAEACRVAGDANCQKTALDSAISVYPELKKLILELSKLCELSSDLNYTINLSRQYSSARLSTEAGRGWSSSIF